MLDKLDHLYCEVCQKPFTGEQSKEEHMKSQKHKRKVEMSAFAPPTTITGRTTNMDQAKISEDN